MIGPCDGGLKLDSLELANRKNPQRKSMLCSGTTTFKRPCQKSGVFIDDETNDRYCRFHMPDREEEKGVRRRCASAPLRSNRCDSDVNFQIHGYLCPAHARMQPARCNGLKDDGGRCHMFESRSKALAAGTNNLSGLHFCCPKHEANLVAKQAAAEREEQLFLLLRSKKVRQSVMYRELVDDVYELVVARFQEMEP